MEFQVKDGALVTTEADALLLLVTEDGLGEVAAAVDSAVNGAIAEIIEAGDFSGKANETITVYTRGTIPAKRVILVGLGAADAVTLDQVRQSVATGLQRARTLKLNTVAISPAGILETGQAIRVISEGALLGLYYYHGQKSSDQPDDLPGTLVIVSDAGDEATAAIAEGSAYARGAMLARDLINLPANIATPSYLAEQAEAMAAEVGLKATILGRSQMHALKMGALLGVAQGSDEPPKFIVLEHKPDLAKEGETLVLVGKGVTFDTGGYSLKTRDGMVGMKADMSGGAAVIGAMRIIAELGIERHVVGLIPAADNMVSGKAYRPQDVIVASNGKSIEIISTDAEGRLLLADALVYAQRYQPAAVVDIATLTGSIMVALGHAAAGVYSNDDTIANKLAVAGDLTTERVWRMPMFPEYGKSLESDTADTKNSGGSAGRAGGAGVAAHFLSNFVDYPWAHVDMAGMLQNDGSIPYMPKHSAKGYGARLLAEFVRQWGA